MSRKEQPDWDEVGKALAEIGEAIVNGLNIFKMQMDAGAALNWLFQGRLAAAKESLTDLDPDQLRALSVASFGLSQLADELLAEKGIE